MRPQSEGLGRIAIASLSEISAKSAPQARALISVSSAAIEVMS
jgi:hypothetical protein